MDRQAKAALAVTLVAVAALVVVGVVAVTGDEGRRGERRGDRPGARPEPAEAAATSTTAPPTTTTPRTSHPGEYLNYCDDAGRAWPEVPPHRPGEPARTYVSRNGSDPGNGVDPPRNGAYSIPERFRWGTTTVVSPRADGVLTEEAAVLTNVRSVTCITFVATEGTGRQCRYHQPYTGTSSRDSYELAASRWEVVVYELHSGGVLHRGEVRSSTRACPREIRVSEAESRVAFGLTEADVLAWFDASFVGGAPA